MAYVFRLPSGCKAVMHGGIGWNTVTSKYSKKKNLRDSWRIAYMESLNRLINLDVDIVLGNHPNQSQTFQKQAAKTAEQNPFIDKSE